jgi:hypothetical protein
VDEFLKPTPAAPESQQPAEALAQPANAAAAAANAPEPAPKRKAEAPSLLRKLFS